jgi:hypothetical protein
VIAQRNEDGTITLIWDDPEEHSVNVAREVMESMTQEINEARLLRRALRLAVQP